MHVQFRNPFYHNRFGLLGDKADNNTIYTLPDDTVIPRTAIVVSGQSEYRASIGETNGGVPTPEVDEDVDDNAPAPMRKKPKEGVEKSDVSVKKRDSNTKAR